LTTSLHRAVAHLLSLQGERGDWEGEMVWCPMITAQYVIVRCVVGRPLDAAARAAIIRHFERTRTGEGAWGLHPESPGFVFVTALGYVALRLLGVTPETRLAAAARHWLRAQPGGVAAIPTWGKFWLALIGLYDYRGLNACPPELFLAPAWLPVHPRRYYCHTRSIYLAMAYLYGRRARGALGPITEALRQELYAEPFERIDFAAHRDSVAPTDRCVRPSALLRVAFAALNAHERMHSRRRRRRALDHCFARILFEQKTSRYQGLSPVNALLNCLAIWTTDPAHPELDPSLAGLEAWKWQDEDAGCRYAGARSQTWDTAFAVHALRALPECSGAAVAALRRAHGFLRDGQLTSELSGFYKEHRDPALGGWCFSDGRHRWPVSDCTAEALSAVLAIHEAPGVLAPTERMEEERLGQAVVFLLSRQNRDGGFATYERRRGGPLLERLNPSEMFTRCMTEQSYVECTGSAIAALAHVRGAHPRLHRAAVDRAITRGVRFLRGAQRSDGGYPGFWGINFTYAIFHAVRGLRACGVPADDPVPTRAAQWLIAAQRGDGGWGEHYSGCLEGRYVEHPESQVVMTAWALLALMDIVDPRSDAVARGLAWLRQTQQPDGSWPQQAVNGVFFGSAMLDYRLYKSYFPTWALTRAAALTLTAP
jgi:lanosterol synthase